MDEIERRLGDIDRGLESGKTWTADLEWAIAVIRELRTQLKGLGVEEFLALRYEHAKVVAERDRLLDIFKRLQTEKDDGK